MKQFSVKETRKDSKGHKTTITINTEDASIMSKLLEEPKADNKKTKAAKKPSTCKPQKKALPKPATSTNRKRKRK